MQIIGNTAESRICVLLLTKVPEASKLVYIIQSVGFAVSFECEMLFPSLVLDSAKVGLFTPYS